MDLSLKGDINLLKFWCDFVDCCHHFFVKTGNENYNLFFNMLKNKLKCYITRFIIPIDPKIKL